jgi:hypothetical protein
MSRLQKWVWIPIGIYLILWIGGIQSYHHTHKCVRSHTEEGFTNDQGDVGVSTVCDWTVDNGKRWTITSPILSLIGR